MKEPLLALVLGIAAYLLTREVVAGVLVAAAGWWLFRVSSWRPGQQNGAPPQTVSHSPVRRIRDDEGIAVVCKQVTTERQEWVSVKTGRLYDVLSPDGPEHARPGDYARLIVNGARYVIKRPLVDNP